MCVSARRYRRTVLLHDLEELDHHLGHRAHEDLALATLLRVVHGLLGRGDEGGETEANPSVANPKRK